MESGWLVNSSLSKRTGSAALLGLSYQISPIAPPSWLASLQGRRSRTPQGFGKARARACSIDIAMSWCSSEATHFDRKGASKSLNHQRGLLERSDVTTYCWLGSRGSKQR